MAGLTDILKQTAGGLTPTGGAAGGGTQLQQLQQLVRARQGFAAAPAGGAGAPRASALQEESAAAANRAAAAVAQKQVGLEAAGIEAAEAAQRTETESTAADLTQRRGVITQQAQSALDDLRERERSGKLKLDLERGGLEFERAKAALRLTNDKYITELQQAGSRKRLDDRLAYEAETARAVLGEQMDAFRELLGGRELLRMSEAEFQEMLGRMDLDSSMESAARAAKRAAYASSFGAAGSLVSAGADYAGSRREDREWDWGGGGQKPTGGGPTSTTSKPNAYE